MAGDDDDVDLIRGLVTGAAVGPSDASGSGGGGPGEGYERVKASEKHLLQFQKAMALAPSQCLR